MRRLASFAKELSAMALIQMLTLAMTFGFVAWGIMSPKSAAPVISALDGFWQSTALPFIESQVAGYPSWGKVAYNQVKHLRRRTQPHQSAHACSSAGAREHLVRLPAPRPEHRLARELCVAGGMG